MTSKQLLARFPRRTIEWGPDHEPRILMVCTANICRSPMAEGAMRKALSRAGITAFVDSAGTHGTHAGMPPHPMAVAAAKARGIDITRIRARVVEPEDFRFYDLVVAMDRANRAYLRAIAPFSCRFKLKMLLDYSRSHYGQEVPDPYAGAEWDFDRALSLIQLGCKGLLRVAREVPASG